MAFLKFYLFLFSELLPVLKIRNYLRKFKNEKLPKFRNLSVEPDHLLGFLRKNKCVLLLKSKNIPKQLYSIEYCQLKCEKIWNVFHAKVYINTCVAWNIFLNNKWYKNVQQCSNLKRNRNICLERKWHQNGQCCLKFKINKNTYYGTNC